MKKHIGMITSALLITGILVGAAGCKTTTTTTDNTFASTTNATTTTTTAVTTTQTGNVYLNSASSQFANGLTLSVGLDGFTYKPGQQVSINIKEQNGLAGDNIIPAASNWGYSQLNLGPCGINGSMYAFAVFKGNYLPSDISSLTPLYFWDYTLIPPCAMSPPVSSYTFKPLSDIVMTQYGQYEASLQTYITGYWTGSPKSALNNFDPGVYTIVAGDEWGNLAAVHFTVTTMGSTGVNSSSSTAGNGLMLALSLDSTTYKHTQDVLINVDVKNTLAQPNRVEALLGWQSQGLGPCNFGSPISLFVLSGNYTLTNYNTGVPVVLYNPNFVYQCPAFSWAGGSTFDFYPSSNVAKVYYGGDLSGALSADVQINKDIDLNGYWTGNMPDAVLNSFEAGIYTVVAQDEWGNVAVVHFTVTK